MDKPATTPPRKKVGRKPLGERAMTANERWRASEARKLADGERTFSIRVSGDTLSVIDQFAGSERLTRSEVVKQLLEFAVAQIIEATANATELRNAGASDHEVNALLRKSLSASKQEVTP